MLRLSPAEIVQLGLPVGPRRRLQKHITRAHQRSLADTLSACGIDPQPAVLEPLWRARVTPLSFWRLAALTDAELAALQLTSGYEHAVRCAALASRDLAQALTRLNAPEALLPALLRRGVRVEQLLAADERALQELDVPETTRRRLAAESWRETNPETPPRCGITTDQCMPWHPASPTRVQQGKVPPWLREAVRRKEEERQTIESQSDEAEASRLGEQEQERLAQAQLAVCWALGK